MRVQTISQEWLISTNYLPQTARLPGRFAYLQAFYFYPCLLQLEVRYDWLDSLFCNSRSTTTDGFSVSSNCALDLVVRLRSLQKARVCAKILELTESGSDIVICPIPGVSLSTARCPSTVSVPLYHHTDVPIPLRHYNNNFVPLHCISTTELYQYHRNHTC